LNGRADSKFKIYHSKLTILTPYSLVLLRKILDLVLYGNFFIAFCAVAMLLQTELLLFDVLQWNYLTTFVFAATLFLYALHRIVGMEKVKPFAEKYRYAIITKYQHHILFYAIVGALVAAYFFFSLCFQNQLLIVLPALLSLGYVVPFFGKNRRLRDFDYIKIFLIAIVWAFITVILPVVERKGWAVSVSDILLCIERSLFIFAITVPFDIRDLKVDQHIQVKTIPSIIGIEKSKLLAGLLLVFAFIIASLLYFLTVYNVYILTALGLSYLSTYLLITYSDKTANDYFFTGIMDGTMLIQFLLVLAFYWLSNF